MNTKKIAALLAAEGAVCAALTLLMRGTALLDAGVLAFPFAQLGAGLRALSLLGGACNVLAVALYVCVSLAPLALFTARALRRGFHAEDLLLPLLTLSLFGALYAMVNPAMLDSWIVGGRTLGLPVLGGVLYAEALAYALLRLLRAAFSAEAARLRQYFTAVLVLAAAVFIYCAFGSSLRTLLLSLDTLHTQNTASASDAAFFGSTLPALGSTEVFLVLRYAADAAPYVLVGDPCGADAPAGACGGGCGRSRGGGRDRHAPMPHCIECFGFGGACTGSFAAPFHEKALQRCTHRDASACAACILPCSAYPCAARAGKPEAPCGQRPLYLGGAMPIRVHLDDILRARGMTAKELCAKVGITEANLSILRSGKAKGVRFATINLICYFLECDVGDILKFDGQLEADDDE